MRTVRTLTTGLMTLAVLASMALGAVAQSPRRPRHDRARRVQRPDLVRPADVPRDGGNRSTATSRSAAMSSRRPWRR